MNRLAACVLAFMAVLFPVLAAAQAGTLVVQNAWMRKAPGVDTAAVYMVLRNTGTQPVTVVGVQSPIASHVMMHETSEVDGQSRMRMLDKVVVAPGQSVTFAPGGKHVMLSGFNQSVAVGQRVPLVLMLADGEQVQTTAVVRPLDAQ